MNVQTSDDTIEMIPLSDLTLSDLNARATVIEGEIEAMADSIAVSGLLQNLIGYRDEEGRVGIVGGGKRLRALKLLQSEKWSRVPQHRIVDPVPVKVTDDHIKAVAWSGTENTARSDLHPADEVRAYARMRNQGNSLGMIARTFAKSELHVERRLKLADLPDTVLDALRADRITIDVARALTLAPSPDAAEQALDAACQPRTTANDVRRMFTQDRIRSDDRRVIFVGLDAYLAAGGTADTDLFEGASYLHDEKLLDDLFKDALRAKADQIKADEGWAWVEFTTGPHIDYTMTAKLDRIFRQSVDLSEADQSEMDAIEARIDAIQATEADHARAKELRERRQGDFAGDDLAHAGIFICVDWRGDLTSSGPHRKPAATTTDDNAGGTDQVSVDRSGAEPARDMPQNLLDDLARIKLACLQAAALDKPELMLDLLAFSLQPEIASYGRPIAVRMDTPTITPEKLDGTTIDARLSKADEFTAHEVADAAAFEAFRAKGKKHRNTVLTTMLARHLQLDTRGIASAVAAEAGAQIRRSWSPTAAGFFGRCGGPYLDRLWAQFLGLESDDERRDQFVKLKKADKAKALDALFNDLSAREAHGLSREQNAAIDTWAPGELRFEDG
ncbi:ParB/RepB/Spo0J family partition protein [Loktanella sp. TSTF-M6]|uniref:ParB/RepB/Spo0J family partition protein n=1 Tax=Loktanella gaetbuli TaxID=2881335 RepID=A0ABS8BTI7_9RHOB|nr:ParB/RepB/Spo0J family partition protein [Loktanella gaetbuli]MCB5199050.1 ParB/RepB/Spo0J family partition protein [Loktanella gaetbuli]